MKKALIILPYANPHLGLFIKDITRIYDCDFYVDGPQSKYRNHFELHDVAIKSETTMKVLGNYFKGKYDVLISHGMFHAFSFFLHIGPRKPLIILSEPLKIPTKAGLLYWLKRSIIRSLKRKHQLNIFILGDLSNSANFQSLAGQEIPCFPYGYFPDWQSTTNTKSAHADPVKFVYAGQFIERKNILLLLAGINLYCNKNGHAEFHFAGEGPFKSEIEANSNITFHGKLDAENVRKLLSASDVMILVSRSEGWGAIVNEAAACGCALMLSEAVEAKYLFLQDGNTGVIVKESPQDIADAITKLSHDRNKLQHMKNNVQELYSTIINSHFNKLTKLLNNATSGNHI